MKYLKKVHLFICGLMLVFTGIFFIACGEEDYSKVSLTCDVSSITLDVGETKSVTFSIQNYFNGMSAELNLSTLNSSNIIQCQPSSPQQMEVQPFPSLHCMAAQRHCVQ